MKEFLFNITNLSTHSLPKDTNYCPDDDSLANSTILNFRFGVSVNSFYKSYKLLNTKSFTSFV